MRYNGHNGELIAYGHRVMIKRKPHSMEFGSKRIATCEQCHMVQGRVYLPGQCIACNGKLVRYLLTSKQVSAMNRPVIRNKSALTALANRGPVSNYRRIRIAHNKG